MECIKYGGVVKEKGKNGRNEEEEQEAREEKVKLEKEISVFLYFPKSYLHTVK